MIAAGPRFKACRAITAAALAAGLLLAGGPGALPPGGSGPAPADAASPNLTLVSAATYTVQPAARRVAVKVAITATNHLHDTVTKRYYYRTGYLAVLPATTRFAIRT